MGGQRPRDPAETEKGEGVTRNREKGRQGIGQRSKGARSPGKGEGSEAGTRDSNETTDTDVGGKQGQQGGDRVQRSGALGEQGETVTADKSRKGGGSEVRELGRYRGSRRPLRDVKGSGRYGRPRRGGKSSEIWTGWR